VSDAASLVAAWARADAAKKREIACHHQAILLQDHATLHFERLGLSGYAALARGRARHAVVALQTALDERAETDARRSLFVARHGLGPEAWTPPEVTRRVL
jgi:hypothetical protein